MMHGQTKIKFEINFQTDLLILKDSVLTPKSLHCVYDFRSSSEGKFFSLQF